MSVTLRKRPLSKGRSRLYIDLYSNYKTESETLDLFLYDKPQNFLERDHNKRTKELADTIVSRRVLEVQDGKYDFNSKFKAKASFLDYFHKLTQNRRQNEGNYGNWLSTYKILLRFSDNKGISFGEVNEVLLNRFKDYLLNEPLTKSHTKLSQSSAHSYFNKVKAALNQAFEEKIITENPAKRVKGIKEAESKREYLTLEELRSANATDCDSKIVKEAFLFSTMTGLRWSDIQKLTWKEVIHSEHQGTCTLQFTQQKTKGVEFLPVPPEAAELLKRGGHPDERVFKGLKYSAWNNLKIREWMMRAGIMKKITFHCARHTYATLMLSNNVDIYTVSKLLGHKELKTTQIYAKVLDSMKINAVNNFPSLNV